MFWPVTVARFLIALRGGCSHHTHVAEPVEAGSAVGKHGQLHSVEASARFESGVQHGRSIASISHPLGWLQGMGGCPTGWAAYAVGPR